MSLLNRLDEFNFTDLYNSLKHELITIDESLTIPNATKFFRYRNFDFSKNKQLPFQQTIPHRRWERSFILTENFYNFIKSQDLLD